MVFCLCIMHSWVLQHVWSVQFAQLIVAAGVVFAQCRVEYCCRCGLCTMYNLLWLQVCSVDYAQLKVPLKKSIFPHNICQHYVSNNSDLSKYFEKKWKQIIFRWFLLSFALETMSVTRRIMEQCRLCPAKSRSLHILPWKITEPSYFAPTIGTTFKRNNYFVSRYL